MALTNEQVSQFQELWKKNFGIEITKELAYEKGVKLMRLMSIIYKPMTDNELRLVQERLKAISESNTN